MTTTTTTETTTTAAAISLSSFDNDKNKNKLEAVASGIPGKYCIDILKKQSNQNALTIADYLLALNTEINPSLTYKAHQIKTLAYLSLFCKQKPFIQMTRDDILAYLDSIRRPEESDPFHKWIGTYNLRRIYFQMS